jgi:hypothetical protein
MHAGFWLDLGTGCKLEEEIHMAKPFPAQSGARSSTFNWHHSSEDELCFYGQSFHKAAQALVKRFELEEKLHTDWDACPVVFMYRQAVELHLKAIILGSGANFLLSKRPVPAWVYSNHSLRRLLLKAWRIVKAVGWDREFKCEGVSDLAEMRAILDDLETLDAGSFAFRYPVANTEKQATLGELTFDVLEFAKQMDAVFDLLNATADALEATWDTRNERTEFDGEDSGPATIH